MEFTTRLFGKGYPNDGTHTYEGDKADSFSIMGEALYRKGPSVKTADHLEKIADIQQNVSVSNIARSVILVDDTNVYWIGGGVNFVFSVPQVGGATKKLAHVRAGLGVELAIAGDAIYAIALDGSIESLKKNGPENQDATYLGAASIGSSVNAIWAETDGTDLFIASDSTETMNTDPPVFDSRVVKVSLPTH